MAMSQVDYNRAISKSRETYFDAAKKMKENFSKDLGNIQTQANAKNKTQLKVHQLKEEELHHSNNEKLEKINRKVRDEMGYQGKIYRDSLKGKTKEFNDIRIKANSKFKRDVEDITTAYNKSVTENNRINTNSRKRIKNNFDDRLKNLQTDNDSRFNNIKEISDNSITKLNHENAESKKDLLRQNDAKTTSFVRETTERENRLKDYYNAKYNELSRINSDEVKSLNSKVDGIINDARKQGSTKTLGIINHYQNLLAKEAKSGMNNERDLLHGKKMALNGMQRGYEQDLFRMRRNMALAQSANGAEAHEKELLGLNKKFTEREMALENNNLDYQSLTNHKIDEMNGQYKNSLDQIKRENSNNLSEKQGQFAKRFNGFQFEAGRKLGETTNLQDRRFASMTKEKNGLLVKKDKESKELLKRQSASFSKAMRNIEANSTKQFEEMNDNFKSEKEKILVESDKELYRTTSTNRKENAARMMAIVDNYENRLMLLEKQKTKVVGELEQKLEDQAKFFYAKIKETIAHEKDLKLASEIRAMENLSFVRKSSAKENQMLRETFNRKIGIFEEEKEIEMNNLKRASAEKEHHSSVESLKKLKAISDKSVRDLNNLNNQAKAEKEQLIQNYEIKLDDLRRNYTQTLKRLQDENARQRKFSQNVSG